jgi:hypothetical protein
VFQNFHTKAAIVILQSRMNLPVIRQKDGSIKVNKWVSDISNAVMVFRVDGTSAYSTLRLTPLIAVPLLTVISTVPT